MVAAPNCCIGGIINRGTNHAVTNDSKRVSEDGETGADY